MIASDEADEGDVLMELACSFDAMPRKVACRCLNHQPNQRDATRPGDDWTPNARHGAEVKSSLGGPNSDTNARRSDTLVAAW